MAALRFRPYAVAVLAIAAAGSGVGVCVLAWGGAPQRSPLNVEGIFALACLGVLLLRAGGSDLIAPPPPPSRQMAWLVAALLLTAGVYWMALRYPFVGDDYILIRNHLGGFSARQLFAQPGGDGSFRPIGYLSLGLNRTFAGDDPLGWRLASLAMHCISVALVFRIVVALNASDRMAFVSAALFGLHGAHPEVVSWVAGRFDVLATMLALLSMLVFILHGSRPTMLLLSGLLLALAMWSKESAYITPLLLLCLLASARRATRDNLRRLAALFGIALALLVYRWWLFGGPGGYVSATTGRPQIFDVGIVTTAKALALRTWAILLFPINWSVPPGALLAGLTTLFVAGCVVVCCATRAARSTVLYLIAGVIISVLPALHLALIGRDLAGARVLYLPSIAFALLIGHAGARIRIGGLRISAIVVLLSFSLAALIHNLRIWGDVAAIGDRACRTIATQIGGDSKIVVLGTRRNLEGVSLFANGLAECLDLRAGHPVNVSQEQSDASDTRLPVFIWDEKTQSIRRLGP